MAHQMYVPTAPGISRTFATCTLCCTANELTDHVSLATIASRALDALDAPAVQVEMPEPRRCPGGPKSPATNETYMFRRQMDRFIQCILTGAQPDVSARDGLATLAVVEAVYESQRTGQKVRVRSL
jgi:predicted dehydrogenase